MKNIYAIFFVATTLILGSLSPTVSTIVYADEGDISTTVDQASEVIKNDKWVAMEQETATMQFKLSSELNPEAASQYLFDKYDGAEMYSVRAGIGQRLQNGGWNVYYNTASGKQTARTGYNGMYVAAAGGATASGILAAFAKASGVGLLAGVAAGFLAATAGKLASYAVTCRDNIDKHGNTGTARIALTEARWSSSYDYRW
ncbi:hypothetical protein [Enterococcus villorum]|uniref:Uncharacterized protein n=2 Tax=Enterococcus villorum TaxID=112904 RepID=A0A511J3R9_9ENTE|nr:hypothetical protein [Enterococcus villorum]EOH88786.1 hypothetical protein UAO_01891 [Enterococcus villorum ATCC 700913]EOW76423.1 hypothetical protein I591_01727 [Enterococcus villorum ATCC 700913]GEL92642.1 hypothetical protein EVI01_19790 [Enterococcus villorum]